MPYIALQLVGVQACLTAMGVKGEWPLIIAFVVLALYTYSSGLRAPALIAFVKDGLIYLVIIVAIIVIPAKLGGFGNIFSAAAAKFSQPDGPILRIVRATAVHHPGAGVGPGADALSALGDRGAGGGRTQCGQAQHGDAARPTR